MDFKDLSYFTTIAEVKSLTKAANLLYVSQPTLTKYIQRLEEQTGLTLFKHVGHTLTLTYAGQRYLEYANQLLSIKRKLDKEMLDIQKSDIGVLRIGMPPIRCSFTLPVVLPEFHQAYPNIEIQITETTSSELDHALLNDTIDIAFFNLYEKQKGIGYEKIEDDEMYVVTSIDHPVKEKAILQSDGIYGAYMKWFKNDVLLIQKRSQRQGEFSYQLMKELHFTPEKILENSNIHSSAALTANAYGICFMSGKLVQHFRKDLNLACYRILDKTYPTTYVAAYKEGTYLPHYAKAFIDLIKTHRDAF